MLAGIHRGDLRVHARTADTARCYYGPTMCRKRRKLSVLTLYDLASAGARCRGRRGRQRSYWATALVAVNSDRKNEQGSARCLSFCNCVHIRVRSVGDRVVGSNVIPFRAIEHKATRNNNLLLAKGTAAQYQYNVAENTKLR
jgi:hypothetical protein